MNTKQILAVSLACMLSNCLACSSVELDPTITNSDPALIKAIKTENSWLGENNVGDTTIKVKPDKDVLPPKPSKKPDLSKIQKGNGNFRLLSVGGGLSAGFRDGGLYREGQLTAFPNLIAQQMGIDFVQPLFSETEGNGTGYKTVSGIEPLVSYKMVGNNLGVKQGNGETIYTDYAGKGKTDIDQFAFPGIQKGLQFYRYPNAKINNDYKYTNRVASEEIKAKFKTPSDWIAAQNADLFIFEMGFDETVSAIKGGGYSIGGGPLSGYVSTSPEFLLMQSLVKSKNKLVMLNVPNIFDFPYFQQITEAKTRKLGVTLFVQTSSGSENYRPFDYSIDHLIPTPTVEKLLRGELKDIVRLQDEDVISEQYSDLEITQVSPNWYNTFEVERQAGWLGIPVVDMYGLYKRILAGGYSTDDGVAVNPAWPRGGNFFSADGIYPTAFGQAVVANEVIKTINKHYGTDIPLLQTRFFLNK